MLRRLVAERQIKLGVQAQLNDYSTCVTGFPPQLKKTNPITVGFFFCFISGTGCDCRKGKGMLNKTQDVCALSHTFFYDFAVHRKQMPTIIRRSVDEIQHIDKARRGLVVYNYKIIQMVDNLCTMCVLYSRCKFIY